MAVVEYDPDHAGILYVDDFRPYKVVYQGRTYRFAWREQAEEWAAAWTAQDERTEA